MRWVPDNPFKDSKSERLARVMDLIHAFRVRGHLMADTDPPLQYRVRHHPDLDVETYGLTLWDLDRIFPTRGLGGKDEMPLRDILGVLRDAYCRTIGVEYMHISDPEERLWLQREMETPPRRPFEKAELRHIMDRLNSAEAFETFLQTKFVGQKRFSLEGGGVGHPAAGHGPERSGALGHRRGLHRHGPSRSSERAVEPRGQELRTDLPGVRGQHGGAEPRLR